MKLVTYVHNGRVRPGVIRGAETEYEVLDLSGVAADMLSLIEMGAVGLRKARSLAASSSKGVRLDDVKLLAPIPFPRRNIMCLGLNYAEHAQESLAAEGKALSIPEAPIVFTKATTSVTGPFDDIPLDAAVTEELDWEVELAVVIGHEGKNTNADQADEYIFGYTIINDISARDLQRAGKQFFKGKSLDGACPMGPWIVTADEMPDPGNLALSCRVNGQTKQDSSTRHMIFNVQGIVAYLSKGMTLLPGDVIATGTPSGVGFARQPPEFLQAGDVVECEVEGIGTIRNRVVAAV